MRYLYIRREEHNGLYIPGLILVALIMALGLVLGVASNAKAQMCGDVNGSQAINVSDIVYLVNYLLSGGQPPVSLDSADVDSISGVSHSDCMYLLYYIFRGGPPPNCPPYPPDSVLPVTTDTLEVRNLVVPSGQSYGKVDLWLKSTDTVFGLSLPFQYGCLTSNITLDSISFVGSAYTGNAWNEDSIYIGMSMGVIGIASYSGGGMTADSGLVASLWFSVTPSADSQYIHIDTTTTPPGNITVFTRGGINHRAIAFIPTIIGLSPQIVTSVLPRQNALNVPVSTDIIAHFGYDLDAGTVMGATFVVSGRLSGLHDGIISYDAPARTATFDPVVDFQPGEEVTVILSTGIHYQGGGPIDSGFVWSFNTAARGGTGMYNDNISFNAGSNLSGICAVDLDGDGDNDLAATGDYVDSVFILLNNGDGTFQPPANYITGHRASIIVAADFDRDGDMDLVNSNYTSQSISILKNNGDGTFQGPTNLSVGAATYAVEAADFDGDGDVDIAVSTGIGTVGIFSNNGDASFQALVSYPSGGTTLHGMSASDLDGDGDIDVATANYDSNTVSILRNNGDATFSGPTNYAVGNSANAVAAADLDGDGDNDLMAVNGNSSTITVLINNGEGNFGERADYPTAGTPHCVVATDIDGDGDKDLVVPNYGPDNVSVLRNNGDGTFRPTVNYIGSADPYRVSAADLDGDGDCDLAVPSTSSGDIMILWNRGDFLVQNTDNVGMSSLRWAILQANANQLRGADTIVFSVSGTIPLASTLPAMIDDSTVILGSTAPGGSGSVILDGAGIAGEGDGLVVQSQENVIEGLTIRNFPGNGITVGGVLSVHNRLTHNLIYNNYDLAIDLEPRGVTDNDVGDGDSGPNDLLNYPEIDSVYMNADSTFSVYGRAAGDAVVELYLAHPAGDQTRPADSSGHGEAYGYVGVDTADVSGHFTYIVSKLVSQFSVISCIAVDTLENTSEFAENFVLTPAPLIVVAYSPVNIILTDPNGLHFGKDSLGNLIDDFPPGEAGYFESPNDSIVVYHPVLGQYSITFIAEAGAPMGSTYSSIIKVDGTQQVVIVDDNLVPISGTTADYTYEVIEGYHYVNGDANRDAAINLADAVYLINYVFKGGSAPDPVNAGDANCDLAVNLADAVKIINYVFKGDTPPCDFEP